MNKLLTPLSLMIVWASPPCWTEALAKTDTYILGSYVVADSPCPISDKYINELKQYGLNMGPHLCEYKQSAKVDPQNNNIESTIEVMFRVGSGQIYHSLRAIWRPLNERSATSVFLQFRSPPQAETYTIPRLLSSIDLARPCLSVLENDKKPEFAKIKQTLEDLVKRFQGQDWADKSISKEANDLATKTRNIISSIQGKCT